MTADLGRREPAANAPSREYAVVCPICGTDRLTVVHVESYSWGRGERVMRATWLCAAGHAGEIVHMQSGSDGSIVVSSRPRDLAGQTARQELRQSRARCTARQ